MQQRRSEALKEAEDLLERIGKRRTAYYAEGASEQEQREMHAKRQNVLRGARELLENQKKTTEKHDNYIDILGDTNRLEREFFEGEEEDSSFNLLAELTTIRNNILTTSKRKK
jgi:hypothetical protein